MSKPTSRVTKAGLTKSKKTKIRRREQIDGEHLLWDLLTPSSEPYQRYFYNASFNLDSSGIANGLNWHDIVENVCVKVLDALEEESDS